MQCLGRTASLARCRKDARVVVCYQHRYQPYALSLSLLTIIGLIAGLYQDLIRPLLLDSVEDPKPFLEYKNIMPFGTGWIFLGYFHQERQVFIEGPYSEVAFRPGSPDRGNLVPEVGDILRITKPRHVLIADYKTDGLKNQFYSPPLVHDPLDADDETDVVLEKDMFLLTRDVEMSGYPGKPLSIWCRVAACDPNIVSCVEALREPKS